MFSFRMLPAASVETKAKFNRVAESPLLYCMSPSSKENDWTKLVIFVLTRLGANGAAVAKLPVCRMAVEKSAQVGVAHGVVNGVRLV
ncbi:hypothetical protein ASD75_08430 [Acidovorax sp. Root568]|nr:hypothetical protein ASD75_08430 [Acidovorax sp. Root568]